MQMHAVLSVVVLIAVSEARVAAAAVVVLAAIVWKRCPFGDAVSPQIRMALVDSAQYCKGYLQLLASVSNFTPQNQHFRQMTNADVPATRLAANASASTEYNVRPARERWRRSLVALQGTR